MKKSMLLLTMLFTLLSIAQLNAELIYSVDYTGTVQLPGTDYLHMDQSIDGSPLRFWWLSVTADSLQASHVELDTNGNLIELCVALSVENTYGFTMDHQACQFEQMGTQTSLRCIVSDTLGVFQFEDGVFNRFAVFDLESQYHTRSDEMREQWNEDIFLTTVDDRRLCSCNIETGILDTLIAFTDCAEMSFTTLGQEYILLCIQYPESTFYLFDADFNLLDTIDAPLGGVLVTDFPGFYTGGGYILEMYNMVMYSMDDYVWVEDGQLYHDDAFMDDIEGDWSRNGFTALDDETFFHVWRMGGSSSRVPGYSMIDHELEYYGETIDNGKTIASLNSCLAIFSATDSLNQIHICDRVAGEFFTFDASEVPLDPARYWKSFAIGQKLFIQGSQIYRYDVDFTHPNDDPAVPQYANSLSNYPNPFNPTTTIHYSIAENSHVTLDVYNIRGQRVIKLVDDRLQKGEHSVVWDGNDDTGNSVSSGVYLYRMKAGDRSETKKMMLMK